MQRRSPCSFCEYCSGVTAASRYSPSSFEKSHSNSIILRSQIDRSITLWLRIWTCTRLCADWEDNRSAGEKCRHFCRSSLGLYVCQREVDHWFLRQDSSSFPLFYSFLFIPSCFDHHFRFFKKKYARRVDPSASKTHLSHLQTSRLLTLSLSLGVLVFGSRFVDS
jgi:hypothetical protein